MSSIVITTLVAPVFGDAAPCCLPEVWGEGGLAGLKWVAGSGGAASLGSTVVCVVLECSSVRLFLAVPCGYTVGTQVSWRRLGPA